MTDPILARCNGTLAVATERGIGIVEQGGGWLGTAVFVAGLVGFIGVAAGIALTVSVGVGGLVPLALGALGLGITALFLRAKRRRKDAPLPAPWLIIDLEARTLIRHGGSAVPLAQVRLEQVFQAGSSSKALALRCPDKLVIARGTPFGDSVDALEQALRSRGVG